MISPEVNEQLTGDFLEVEVVTTLKQMAPMKVPGPDGMPPLFYQHFLPLIKGDLPNLSYLGLILIRYLNRLTTLLSPLYPRKKKS